MNLALGTLKPPLKPTGRSAAAFESLRCKVGRRQAERDEDVRRVPGSSAAPDHPRR